MADFTVFYSWQSDLPNSTNRGFIQNCLERATKTIRQDRSIAIEPVMDRDTSGVPGSPDIVHTIFAKINNSQIFVGDVTIINNTSKSRPTPNPNVLIELGFAINALGAERIIMVLNTAFGDVTQLPFDLRMRRVVTYHMPTEGRNKAEERKVFQKKLENAIRLCFTQQPTQVKEDKFNILLERYNFLGKQLNFTSDLQERLQVRREIKELEQRFAEIATSDEQKRRCLRIKNECLKVHLTALVEEYEALNKQLSYTLSEADKVTLKYRIDSMEPYILQIEEDLKNIDSN